MFEFTYFSIAILIPRVTIVFGLMGSTASVYIQFLIPAMMLLTPHPVLEALPHQVRQQMTAAILREKLAEEQAKQHQERSKHASDEDSAKLLADAEAGRASASVKAAYSAEGTSVTIGGGSDGGSVSARYTHASHIKSHEVTPPDNSEHAHLEDMAHMDEGLLTLIELQDDELKVRYNRKMRAELPAWDRTMAWLLLVFGGIVCITGTAINIYEIVHGPVSK
jgi:hypothetical protein